VIVRQVDAAFEENAAGADRLRIFRDERPLLRDRLPGKRQGGCERHRDQADAV
jgi:hypothetical protein